MFQPMSRMRRAWAYLLRKSCKAPGCRHLGQSLDKTAQLGQAGAGQAHVRLEDTAVEGGVDVIILPLLWIDSLLHRTLIVRDGPGLS